MFDETVEIEEVCLRVELDVTGLMVELELELVVGLGGLGFDVVGFTVELEVGFEEVGTVDVLVVV